MGFLNAQQSKNETILCSLGYSNTFSGTSAALVFIGGIIGSFAIGFVLTRIQRENILVFLKICCLPVGAILLLLIFLLQIPNQHYSIAFLYLFLGFFTIG